MISTLWSVPRAILSSADPPTVVADCCLAGVSTRRMHKLVVTLGIDGLSKSQVLRMAADLDSTVENFRHRSLRDAGPFTFVAADALIVKVREGGRIINTVVLLETGMNIDGHREVTGASPISPWSLGWLIESMCSAPAIWRSPISFPGPCCGSARLSTAK